MIVRIQSILLTLCMAASACDNSPSAAPAPSSAAPAPPPASGSATTVASAAPATVGPTASWTGSYKSEAGTLYVPTEVPNAKDWKDVKWRGDLSNAGLGDGPIALTVDPSGRVTGTLGGPLGPAMINGQRAGDKLTASITRQTPSDGGFVGTLVGSVSDDKVTGTMKLSQREASVIRSATFSAAKK